MTADLHTRATSTTRSIRVYVCPTCKRRVKRRSKPAPCCGVKLAFVGSINETVAVEPEERVEVEQGRQR